MKRGLFGLALAFGILGAVVLVARPLDLHFGVEHGRGHAGALLNVSDSQASAQTPEAGIESLRNQSKAFVQISKQVLPSVVSITSERTVRVTGGPGRGSPRGFGGDLFRFFESPELEVPQMGSGSGVIVSKDGYILTNNHVVAQADKIRVTLEDDRSFDGELVGRDPKSDVAVIRIKAADLTPARLGDSDKLEVGEWVLAVGNPFQLSSTVTAGIVSAMGRNGIGLADYEQFIQTDAAINPGNSGGAMVNLNGEVVGINTAIATRSGGNQGIGFAIPINMASKIMDSLISTGHVVRGWLGVQIQNLNANTADYFGLDKPKGALVGSVVDGSPAEKAGLKQGDLILAIDGHPVKDVEDLQLKIVDMKPGTSVELMIRRDGKDRTATVKLGELESDDTASVNEEHGGGAANGNQLDNIGLSVEELTLRTRQQIDLPRGVDGVVVSGVDMTKPAGQAGLQRGDVITKVGDTEIHSAAGFARALAEVPKGKSTLFLVRRGDAELFLGLRMPE